MSFDFEILRRFQRRRLINNDISQGATAVAPQFPPKYQPGSGAGTSIEEELAYTVTMHKIDPRTGETIGREVELAPTRLNSDAVILQKLHYAMFLRLYRGERELQRLVVQYNKAPIAQWGPGELYSLTRNESTPVAGVLLGATARGTNVSLIRDDRFVYVVLRSE